MTAPLELDPIDRKILRLIQVDCTASIQAIADEVGLSANPCWRRLKRMEEAGVIQARVALVDPVALGLKMTAFVAIRTDTHTTEWLEGFGRAVRQIPEIIECHRMSGETDYLLKVIVSDIDHYDRVYRRLIAAAPGLSDVSSAFSMERLKHGTALDVR
jgi:Lrp/AsnC family transcriptional regulator